MAHSEPPKLRTSTCVAVSYLSADLIGLLHVCCLRGYADDYTGKAVVMQRPYVCGKKLVSYRGGGRLSLSTVEVRDHGRKGK
jgi:hypothetical protein